MIQTTDYTRVLSKVLATLSKRGIIVHPDGGVELPASVLKSMTSINLCRIEGNRTEFKIKYITERWNYFNDVLFGAAMRFPSTIVIENKKNMLGSWHWGYRRMMVGRYQFMATNDRELLNTLVHEMCHQYVDEVLHSRDPDAHGKEWMDTMVSVGLPPSAKFTGPKEVLMDKVELKRQNEKREFIKKMHDMNKHRMTDDIWKTYTVFRYINPEHKYDCPAINIPHNTADDFMAVVIIMQKLNDWSKARYVRKDHLTLPGPLKVKTEAYRIAQAKADEFTPAS